MSVSGSNNEASLVCPNGHANPTGQRFCGECGAELEANIVQTPPPPPPVEDHSASAVEEHPPSGWSRRRTLLLVVGAVVIVALGYLAFGRSNKHTVTGTIVLSDTGSLLTGTSSSISGTGGECYGTGGYSDMSEGATVTVRDGEGNVAATSSLSAGTNPGNSGAEVIIVCGFGFTVDVPDEDFYSFEVGSRGAVTYSREDLESKDWKVELSLGS